MKILSTNTLKVIAIIAMLCDHIPYLTEELKGHYYDSPWFLMHAFGRITAPVFFYLLALGYRRTRDVNAYTVRLLVFAVISYVPYIWYFYFEAPGLANFYEFNVIFTMLVGLLLLRALREVKYIPLKVILIALCFVCGYWCDYGLYGLAMILVCDVARGSRGATVLGLMAVMITYVYVRLGNIFPGEAGPFEYLGIIAGNPRIVHLFVVLGCQVLPLILIACHRVWDERGAAAERKPGFLAKYGFYVFYPAHISILWLVRYYII